MKITQIPQFYREVNRSLEIVAVLSKYGLADWLKRLDIGVAPGLFRSSGGDLLSELSLPQRIRHALSELGPTFIKLGQMISTRADLVGPELAEELKVLQADAPADPPEVVRKIIAAELKRPVEAAFAEFDDRPLASASIGQAHRARLADGRDVVVKVQHAGIEKKIRVDLEIMLALADLAERLPEFKSFAPRQTLAEFQRAILRELDFTREQRNLQEFLTAFANDPLVRFPRPIMECSTERVLTMEFLAGTSMANLEPIRASGVDLCDLAARGTNLFLRMIFEHRFYHADPHPGNLLVLEGGVIGVLDCGMVGRLDEAMTEDIQDLLMAIVQRDVSQLQAAALRLARVPPRFDATGLNFDLTEFVSHYGHVPLSQLDLRVVLNEAVEILRRYKIVLPGRTAMLVRVLVMLEGLAKQLNPQVSVTELLQPHLESLYWKRVSPLRQLKRWRRMLLEWESLGEVLPRQMIDILQQIQSGQMDLRVEHRGLDSHVDRLVMGILAGALFLGSAWMLAHKLSPVIVGDISILGLAGCIVAVLMGLRLWWTMKL